MRDNFNEAQRKRQESIDHFLEYLDTLPKTTYEPGQTIIPVNDSRRQIGIMHEGLAKARVRWLFDEGDERTQFLVGDKMWFGLEVFNREVNNFGYVAVEECYVTLMPVSFIYDNEDMVLLRGMLVQMIYAFEQNVIKGMSMNHDLENRLLYLLWDIRSKTSRMEVGVSVTDLADLVHSHRTNVSKLLKKFKEQGLVDKSAGDILLAKGKVLYEAWKKMNGKSD